MLNIKWGALILALLMFVIPAFAVEENLTFVGGDETTIREFMQIYLRDMSSPDTEITVYIGQLPEDLPVDIPAVDGKIIGAIVREGPYSNTEMIFVSGQSVDATEAFFETELGTLGWERIGMNYGQRGFIAEQMAYADFCKDDSDNFINVNLREIGDETQIRLNINQSDPYMCNQDNMEEVYQNDPYLRLPELTTPEGVTMLMNRGGGGGGGGYPGNQYSSTSTWLTSDVLSLDQLMDAYNTQLAANGWEQMSTEASEHVSLSLWSFTHNDTRWSGYFSLMENAVVDGQYYATIMVEQVGE